MMDRIGRILIIIGAAFIVIGFQSEINILTAHVAALEAAQHNDVQRFDELKCK